MTLSITLIIVVLVTATSANVTTLFLKDLCRYSLDESAYLLLGAVTESFNSTAVIEAASPEFGYNDDINCTLEVSGPPGHHIVASVRRLQLRRNCVDYLTIYADDKKHTFCGLQYDEHETHSLTAQGSMGIQFTSGTISQGLIYESTGFQVTVTAYTDSPCNSTTDFRCENNRCIAGELNCSRHNHCGDNSNQHCATVTDTPRNCSQQEIGQFVCANGNCVDRFSLCDGNDDCGDLSDEMICYNCSRQEFFCRNGKCISSENVCNHENSCGDWSDEEHCQYTCFSWEFSCSNGHCAVTSSVCDGKNDCGDWSDEQNCPSPTNSWYSAPIDTMQLIIILNVAVVLIITIILTAIAIRNIRNARNGGEVHRQLLPHHVSHPPATEEFVNPLCIPTEPTTQLSN